MPPWGFGGLQCLGLGGGGLCGRSVNMKLVRHSLLPWIESDPEMRLETSPRHLAAVYTTG